MIECLRLPTIGEFRVSAPPRAPYDPRQGDPTAATPWLRWLIVGCGALMAGGVALTAAIFLIPLMVVGMASSGPEQVVQSFLSAAAEGDHAGAHDHFSSALKEAQPLEQLTAMATTHRHLFEVTDTTFLQRSIESGRARFEGRATLASGERIPASFTLVKEAGEWKLVAYDLGE